MEYTTHDDIRIIGRKKDVIITRGDKTINPQPIEARLKESALIHDARDRRRRNAQVPHRPP
ncbi:hypothetical protein [Streptomyces formicae]|uniref:hypothetical protein n=1 Tax=Streptomyces formicae TaxID=1616117 RepID=UPI000BF79248|nr:hypothetical protein [Streptomyces formicae]